jgi:hypothetical protein
MADENAITDVSIPAAERLQTLQLFANSPVPAERQMFERHRSTYDALASEVHGVAIPGAKSKSGGSFVQVTVEPREGESMLAAVRRQIRENAALSQTDTQAYADRIPYQLSLIEAEKALARGETPGNLSRKSQPKSTAVVKPAAAVAEAAADVPTAPTEYKTQEVSTEDGQRWTSFWQSQVLPAFHKAKYSQDQVAFVGGKLIPDLDKMEDSTPAVRLAEGMKRMFAAGFKQPQVEVAMALFAQAQEAFAATIAADVQAAGIAALKEKHGDDWESVVAEANEALVFIAGGEEKAKQLLSTPQADGSRLGDNLHLIAAMIEVAKLRKAADEFVGEAD